VDALGGTAKVQLLGDGNEVAQVTEFDHERNSGLL
jgi:hypothetical protein